jgi:molecular chaperone GrpE
MKHKDKNTPDEKKTPEKPVESDRAATQELLDKIAAMEKEKTELFERLQRVSADYLNFQKRTDRQIADITTYEKEKIIRTLLPVLDNFEHMLQTAPSAEDIETLVNGIRIIHDHVLGILRAQGVEQIKAAGEKFDPMLHQAMMRRTEPEKEENMVLEEFQKGYMLNGRAIRPSRVVVNVLPAPETAEQPKNQETQTQPKTSDNFETTDTEK